MMNGKFGFRGEKHGWINEKMAGTYDEMCKRTGKFALTEDGHDMMYDEIALTEEKYDRTDNEIVLMRGKFAQMNEKLALTGDEFGVTGLI